MSVFKVIFVVIVIAAIVINVVAFIAERVMKKKIAKLKENKN